MEDFSKIYVQVIKILYHDNKQDGYVVISRNLNEYHPLNWEVLYDSW